MNGDTDNRDLYSGMIRLHILHHAGHEAIFGAGMAEELARHGYKISPGTLYPILHGLEKRGYSFVLLLLPVTTSSRHRLECSRL